MGTVGTASSGQAMHSLPAPLRDPQFSLQPPRLSPQPCPCCRRRVRGASVHPEASGRTGRTRYLRLHVPHVCKSLLLPLKMGLEGQGRDTGEKRISRGQQGAERPRPRSATGECDRMFV